MENAPALQIVTSQAVFYDVLAAHLAMPCERVDLAEMTQAGDGAGWLLLPENAAEITRMNAVLEAGGTPALMLLPEGNARTQPICASLPRPVALEVLKQEVARMLRQPKALTWEGIGRFDPAAMALTATDPAATATLTEKEAALLTFLARHETPATREALLESVWRYHPETETHTLETHLYRLRQKLREVYGERLRIDSDESGYRLITPLP